MGFYDGDKEVVHISNQSANIDNLTVEGKNFLVASDSIFNRQMSVCKVDLDESSNEYKIRDGFTWKFEDDGSFSLVKN